MSRILFLGAHHDDIELSCGGTISKFLEQQHEILYVSFSNCNNQLLREECKASLMELGVKNYVLEDFPHREFAKERQYLLDSLIDINKQFNPEIIVTHSDKDRHQDHRTVGEESLRAFRNKTLISYCSSWNNISEIQKNYFVQLTEQQIDNKIAAIKHYISQQERRYMHEDIIYMTAKFYGNIIGIELAEAFKIERWIQ